MNVATLPELPIETVKPKLKHIKFVILMDLWKFVPPIYHQFFTSLPQHDTSEPNRIENTSEILTLNDERYETVVHEAHNIYESDDD